MQEQKLLQTLFFIVFFSIGAAALSVSILCDDLLQYYANRELLKSSQQALERLESLNADYDALLQQLQKDPNLVERIAPATLGTAREDQNTVYPQTTPEQLDAARKALTEDSDLLNAEPPIPEWLNRCKEPRRRTILFLAGAFLILISFICFGATRQARPEAE
ncbi:MAG: hypothetical protein ACYS4W_01245 [Planctomycetota bacterium]|jgi:hypothetical protein